MRPNPPFTPHHACWTSHAHSHRSALDGRLWVSTKGFPESQIANIDLILS